MNILVTGGAGYIGSVIVEELLEANHRVVVVDNLSKGHRDAVSEKAVFEEADIADRERIESILRTNEIEAVVHMAASSLVGESVQKPQLYFENNVEKGRMLLDAMIAAGVKKIVFSSTAAVYGEPERQPIVETDQLQPTNPYGETKLAFEGILREYEEQHGLKHVSLRYFNAAGATKNCGERHDPETHLIPLVLQTAIGTRSHVEIYGDDYSTRDGTCLRDYVHVLDLARAHILALETVGTKSNVYNLGCGGSGYSVREVIDVAREVTGLDIETRVSARRPGDPAVLIASSSRIKSELNWEPEFQDLKVIVASAWQWMRNAAKDNGSAAATT
jgi:UDP-glucose 4-epimerase